MRDLEKYALECMEMLDNLGITYGNIKEFTVNTRALRRWGQCCKRPNGYYINIIAWIGNCAEKQIENEKPT